MNNLNEFRLMEYDSEIQRFKELEPVVYDMIVNNLKKAGIRAMQIAHRIKCRDSVAEKLQRKPDKYSSILDMTDLLGIRIICYFNDQVDQIADILRTIFAVDEENSVDKRKNLDPTTFGYISLHYICSLKDDADFPDRLKGLRFEIQIRTVLQHTWAEIEHDLGYKTDFGIPKQVRRNFSRVAGLLEIADDAFLQIREFINIYDKDIRDRIDNENFEDMPLDLVSLRAYIELDSKMQSLISDIAAITGSEVVDVSPEGYLKYLSFFGIGTLEELNSFVQSGYDKALLLARTNLKNVELDEVSSIVGLYYLCRAKLVFGDYSIGKLMEFYRLGEASDIIAKKKTARILKIREKIRDKQ